MNSQYAAILREKIAQLTHADRIPDIVANKWIENTLRIDPERIEWHIARANGFGGSDAGPCIAGYLGLPNWHPIDRIVKGKLLLLPPDGPNDDTRRGSELEEHVRARFEHRLSQMPGMEWERSREVEAAIFNTPNKVYPWVRSSVDGIYVINGHRILVDFKAPTEGSLESYRRAFASLENIPVEERCIDGGYVLDYRSQLHHYRLDAECKGIDIDAMWLVMYDYKRNDVEIFVVEHEHALDALLIEAESFAYEHVLNGTIPEPVKREEFVVAEADDDVQSSAHLFVIGKVIESWLKRANGDNRKVVEDYIGMRASLADKRLIIGDYMEIKGERVFDVEAGVARLRELGWSDQQVDELRSAPKYDVKKLPVAYNILLAATRNLLLAVAENGDKQAAIEAMAALVPGLPVKEQGAFDPILVEKALVSCNESPDFYLKEELSSQLARAGHLTAGLDERRELVEGELGDAMFRILSLIKSPAVEAEACAEFDVASDAPRKATN
jgi:hypothetical protein